MERDDLLREFGRRVKAFRDERHLSQDELAELAGMTGKHLGDLERGAKEPGLLALLGVAGALDVDLAALVPFRAGADPFAPRPSFEDWQATLHSATQLAELATRMTRTGERVRAARLSKVRTAASRRPAKPARRRR